MRKRLIYQRHHLGEFTHANAVVTRDCVEFSERRPLDVFWRPFQATDIERSLVTRLLEDEEESGRLFIDVDFLEGGECVISNVEPASV